MSLGKWAIKQAPRCWLKRHSKDRNFRNDWCEYGGQCNNSKSLDGTALNCPIAESYINRNFDVQVEGDMAIRNFASTRTELFIHHRDQVEKHNLTPQKYHEEVEKLRDRYLR